MPDKKILITGAAAADGTGAEPAPFDILIEDDKIACIAQAIDDPDAERIDADITIFDPNTVKDNSTYEDPNAPPSGIHHVLVNGAWILKDGEVTENLKGRVLRFGE